jgi:hypothetical protein
MLSQSRTRPKLADDHGFTLIELLVASLTGLVVVGALFAILEVSMHQTTLVTDKVQANQLGRTAMTRIVDELHSACLSPGFRPIREKSTESELRFINAYSEAAVIPNAKEAKVLGTGAYEHRIVWGSAAHTLVDYPYKSTGGELPSYTFPELTSANATPSGGVLLANNVLQAEESGKKVPIFQYYKYATEATSSASTPVGTLEKQEPPTTGFTTKEAEGISSVLISLRVLPADGKAEHNQYIDVSNQSTLAFSAPNAETPIVDSPCE